jgi:hypothetical protein
MLKAFVGFVIGYQFGERRMTDAARPREGGSASGWLSAFLMLMALLAWGHADLRSHARSDAHSIVAHTAMPR